MYQYMHGETQWHSCIIHVYPLGRSTRAYIQNLSRRQKRKRKRKQKHKQSQRDMHAWLAS